MPGAEPSVAPIAPPVEVFAYPAWMVALAVLLVVALVSGVVLCVARVLRNRPVPPPPSPREVALEALERLRARVEETAVYPFSIEVSDVLRRFVAQEFQLSATRQTSAEFLASAAANTRFSEADKTLLTAFLERVDLIKFARLQATTADSERLLEQAARFVKGGGEA